MLKPGKTDQFVRWAKSLSERGTEVLEALRVEGIQAEHIFLERGASGDSIVFYTRAESLARAAQAFQTSQLPLDLETKRIIAETWELSSIRALEKLIDLP